MSGAVILKGRCLCGAVTVQARSNDVKLRACHCDMCRQHTSSMFISIDTEQEGMIVTGPAKSYLSSEWAERGFCDICGSTLWYGTQEDGARHLSAGLFDNAGGAEVKMEYFSDMCPQGYGLKGDHRRLDTAQTIALFSDTES